MALKNWAISEEIFNKEFCRSLVSECQRRQAAGEFHKASIGHQATKTVDEEIRGDFIGWLQETHPMLENLELLRQSLNQFFFLGLKRVETHFAFYPPGAGYEKHIDNPRGRSHRKITFVLYLNENWQKSEGGELSLFDPANENERIAQVEPTLGKLILFRSELFPHQVEKSFSERLSLTGWFRDDAL